ncbi:MAG: ornithine cyclodeaminase family protein, partial [Chloroflexi bacterium]|nr:ornithine cyclodeaminase family protein [Chloroflexota bacterium]
MTLVLEDEHVAQLLPMADCIDAMETAFRDFANGAVNLPRIRYRSATSDPDVTYGSNIHIGTVPSLDVAAVRIGGSARSTEAKGQGAEARKPDERNWGFICLISMRTGELLAIMQEFVLSGLRVGATSGLAVKHIAREDVATVGMYGSGKLARTDLEAFVRVRPIRRVKVYSPTVAHREAFASEMSAQLEIEVTAVDDPREVVRGVDIVCCATNAGYVSGEPVLDGDWLEPGQLVISLQNSDPNFLKSEVDDATLARSSTIVLNDKESVYANNQQELLGPIERGLVSWDQIALLGDIVAGKTRLDPPSGDQIVYYKNNTGMGIQMAAAG